MLTENSIHAVIFFNYNYSNSKRLKQHITTNHYKGTTNK